MIAWKLFRQMKVIYKKDIIDKILEEIETAKSHNRAIDEISLTYEEAKELIALAFDIRMSMYNFTNFYIKEHTLSAGQDDFIEIEFKPTQLPQYLYFNKIEFRFTFQVEPYFYFVRIAFRPIKLK